MSWLLKNRLFIFGILFIFALPPLYETLPVRVEFSFDNSLPYSLWITKKPFRDERYVKFIPPKNEYTEHISYMIKEISCDEGMLLEKIGDIFYCNKKPIAKISPIDSNGKKLKSFSYNGLIPKDNYFVTGTHPKSYDSRYFGFVDKSNITRGVSPLW